MTADTLDASDEPCTGESQPASSLEATSVLIAIDDTDNLESRGTGRLSQELLGALAETGLGTPLGATRHQLLVDPRIPYTSHNSSACIAWDAGPEPDIDAIVSFCAAFLERESAPGSDPGLAVATPHGWSEGATRTALVEFGQRAKVGVLDQPQARQLAEACGVRLSGHGGTNGGIIGALAAVGLHLSGADGLFLWMPGIRALGGELTYGELCSLVPIDAARDPSGREPAAVDRIVLGDWVRPVMDGGRAVLLLVDGDQPSLESMESVTWEVAPRAVVKAH